MGEPFTFKLKSMHMDKAEIIEKRGLEHSGRVQQYIDAEVLKKCQPYVPMDTGELIRSGIRNTKIGSGEVIYDTPYARHWYYINAQFQGADQRGRLWFERMKQDGGKDAILRGVKRMTGAK